MNSREYTYCSILLLLSPCYSYCLASLKVPATKWNDISPLIWSAILQRGFSYDRKWLMLSEVMCSMPLDFYYDREWLMLSEVICSHDSMPLYSKDGIFLWFYASELQRFLYRYVLKKL
ncbi:hypothetical protein SUGI_0012370 [Cryptomeria japonica]|nr:hypothetical protein SUGI_0012370 [Cryptomeria japonica]